MAHSALHFSIGLALGTAVVLPVVLGKPASGGKTAQTLGRWLVATYALAFMGIIPGFLGKLGVPVSVLHDWWANIFLFYPLVEEAKHGGMVVGGAVIVACFAVQYTVLLIALRRSLTAARDARSSPH